METRNKTLVTIILGMILSLVVIAPVYSKRNDNLIFITPTDKAVVQENFSTAVPGLSAQVLHKYAASTMVETVLVNKIEMSASNFRVVDGYLTVDVCHQHPNAENWTIGEAIVRTKDVEVPLFRTTALEINRVLANGQSRNTSFLKSDDGHTLPVSKLLDSGLPNYRCDTLGFRIGELKGQVNVALTVKYINALPNEREGCAQYRDAVAEALEQKSTGVKFDCEVAGQNSVFVITEKPGSISEEDAKKLILSTFQETITITGPWSFPEVGVDQ